MTMRLIEHIEEHLNLAVMVQQCGTGDLRFSHAARLVSIVLKSAGANVTADEVFAGMFADGDDYDATTVVNVTSLILAAVFPEPKKKPLAKQVKPKS